VLEYSEHSVGKGNKAQAIAYVQIAMSGYKTFGVGRNWIRTSLALCGRFFPVRR